MIEHTCQHCGHVVVTYWLNPLFCKESCAQAYATARETERGEPVAVYPVPPAPNA